MRKTAAFLSFAATFLLVAFAAPAHAQQGSIAGTVTSLSNGSGIAAVQVQVLRGEGSVVASQLTGASGTYRIAGISPGTYSVSFSATGWENQTQTGVAVTAGATTTVSPVMTERAFTLNPISVTTSKQVEKALDAPAAVQVVDREDVQDRPATSLTDYVKEKAAVDVITTGVQSNYVVIRGFNNIFSGQTLTLTDNRIARVPSLRSNISHLQPTTNLDIDRVEVVLGPGSALYGPNAANGVIHYLTQSPIDNPGGALSVAGGLRQQPGSTKTVPLPFDANQNGMLDDVVTRSFDSSTEGVTHLQGRYAWAAPNQRFGVKLSGQYFSGTEYNFIDETEVQQQALAGACIAASFDPTSAACINFSGDLTLPQDAAALQTRVQNVAAGRNNDLERWAMDLRADFRPTEDVNVILSGGRTTAVSSVDLTGIGAGQVKDWKMYYGQARATWKRLFAQVFFNKSDNDQTYLLRSGRPLTDKSSLFVAQLQHGTALSENHDLIYGVDFLHTVPQSEGTINGRYENDDTIDEVGGYVQYAGQLSEKFDLTLAARVDKHSRLEDPVFSPRAAVVYKPNQDNSFRLTFNRAFTTPTTLNLFLDISAQTVPIPGTPFAYDVRAQGTSENGFMFNRDSNGIPEHMSPFAPLLGGTPRDFLPTTTEQLWNEAVALISAGNPQAGQLLQSIDAPTAGQVPVVGATLNTETAQYGSPIFDLSSVADPAPLRETTWQTLEAGYKGLLDSRWLVAVNGYWTKVNDFVSALQTFTPNVFLPEAPTEAYLQSQFRQLVGPQPPFPFASEAEADATAAQLAQTIGQVPLGVLAPEGAGGQTLSPILVTYRNLGDFDLFGADMSISFLLTDNWELAGTVSWVSDETFQAGSETVPLNAPSWKGSLTARYRNDENGLTGAVRARFIDGFPVASGVYTGQVDAYSVFDVNLGYEIPGTDGLRAQLDVQNVFDDGYQTFPGTPTLGRFTVLRLLWTP
ncbi:MAG: TonB-dependent receptor [Gemmatimonadales bacterium]|jgi:iron complex outermembrane receptor protein